MVLKTFNVDEEAYDEFSRFCKEQGMSMSKQVSWFMKMQVAEEPKVKQAYLQKLECLRKGNFVKVDDFAQRYGLRKR